MQILIYFRNIVQEMFQKIKIIYFRTYALFRHSF